MRVFFHADPLHNQAAVIWRCRDLLADRGVQVVCSDTHRPEECDLRLIHSPLFDPEYLAIGPTAILERIDGAQLTGTVRRCLSHTNLRAVIKNTIYDKASWYTGCFWRPHEAACRIYADQLDMSLALSVAPRDAPLTDNDYRKLRVGFSFAAYEHLRPLLEMPIPTGDRPYLLNFAGTTEYPEVTWLTWHRRQTVEQISRVPGKHINEPTRVLDREGYWSTLRQSRFCVSPWGLGECCWRDFEAVLCGCIVIKPDTRHVLTDPEGLYSLPCFRVCKPDFSDLSEVVERCDFRREYTDEYIVRESAEPERIAGRLAEILEHCL